jgi:pimeloyl-ACP methyl ester carboxylesterase
MPMVPGVLSTLAERFDATAFDAPLGSARLRLEVNGEGAWDATVRHGLLTLGEAAGTSDARLIADRETWEQVAADVRGGMDAFRRGRLQLRDDLHLGVGFLAATSGHTGPERLEVARERIALGDIAVLRAGAGEPVVMLHGLGGTKASFLPTVAALAPHHRVIALDLPGFGDSVKPLGAAYDPPFFARAVVDLLDRLGIGRAHVIGNSMGGRVALELGMLHPERTGALALLAPSLAWLRERRWASLLRLVRPELGLLHIAPRGPIERFVRAAVPGGSDGWSAVGVDEFLRAYLTPRGRAAFYAAARNIYLEDPDTFWSRLKQLQSESLFIWGRHDKIVPIGFARHVREAFPAARHLELDCGHVPQLEASRDTHRAIEELLASLPIAASV